MTKFPVGGGPAQSGTDASAAGRRPRGWTDEHRAAHAELIRELWKSGRYDNRRRPYYAIQRCVICGTEGQSQGLRHFNLVIQRSDGVRGNRGAGAIDLCQRCWKDATESSRIKRRPRLRVAA